MNFFQAFWAALTGKKRERTEDDFPKWYEVTCREARAEAIKWYRQKYKQTPRIPFVKVVIENKPLNGMGGWTANAWTIHIYKDQYPFEGSLAHEFARSLSFYNGKPQSEVVGI